MHVLGVTSHSEDVYFVVTHEIQTFQSITEGSPLVVFLCMNV